MHISVYNVKGMIVGNYQRYGSFDYGKLPKGLYIVVINLPNGTKERHIITV